MNSSGTRIESQNCAVGGIDAELALEVAGSLHKYGSIAVCDESGRSGCVGMGSSDVLDDSAGSLQDKTSVNTACERTVLDLHRAVAAEHSAGVDSVDDDSVLPDIVGIRIGGRGGGKSGFLQTI